jgi:hypothetical protein
MGILSRVLRSSAVSLLAVGLASLLCVDAISASDAVADPPQGGSNAALDAAPTPSPPVVSPRQKRAVYVCHGDGIPVFADRPCSAASTARVLTLEASKAGAPATTVPRLPKASTRPLPTRVSAADAIVPDTGKRCTELQRRLDDLDDHMRTGYSAREAARLWQRWREARERLRSAHC